MFVHHILLQSAGRPILPAFSFGEPPSPRQSPPRRAIVPRITIGGPGFASIRWEANKGAAGKIVRQMRSRC
jgi:hypothetical protein